eukprot:scaffold5653_cov136-Isochrysis_galbana.AAC.2
MGKGAGGWTNLDPRVLPARYGAHRFLTGGRRGWGVDRELKRWRCVAHAAPGCSVGNRFIGSAEPT